MIKSDAPESQLNLLQLPVASFVGLEELIVTSNLAIRSLYHILTIIGPTLKHLQLSKLDSALDLGNILANLLPHLQVLQELAIFTYHGRPNDDIFDYLPATLTCLTIPNLSYRHLQHLQSNPRALQLSHIQLAQCDSDAAIFSILPPSVTLVDLEHTDDEKFKAQDIFDALLNRPEGNHFLHKIYFRSKGCLSSYGEDEDNTDDGLTLAARIEWRKKFREIGIEWTSDNFCSDSEVETWLELEKLSEKVEDKFEVDQRQ